MKDKSLKKEPFTLIFEDIATHFPEKTAIYWINSSNGFEAMSYEQLNRKANRLSWYLKSVCRSPNGVNIVAVCMNRNPNYLISLLAIWKAGFVYQPLDNQAEYSLVQEKLSQARTTCLLLDSESKMKLGSLTLSILQSCIEDFEQIFSEEEKYSQNPPNLSQLNDPAYLIASSGTTGRPKMIMNTFEGLPGRLNGFLKHIHLDVNSCVLGFSGYVFDASLMDIMIAWSTVSAILIVPISVQQDVAGKLTALLVSAKEKNINITYAALIPDVIELIDPNLFLFNHLITMGTKAHWPSLRKLIERGTSVYDGYGPTETSIAATLRMLTLDKSTGIVCVDKITKNIEGILPGVLLGLVQKINDDYKVVTDLEHGEGEIALGGEGVGYYWQNESLNQKQFIKLPHIGKGRFYLTGDLAKYELGRLHLLGRNNREIKIYGKKVNLDIFEERLRYYDDIIDDVAVLLINRSIAAFITLKTNAPSESLAKIIIDIPTIFLGLSAFIFSVNQLPKIQNKRSTDYKTLTNATSTELIRKLVSVQPFESYSTTLEEKIAKLCQDIFIDHEIIALSTYPFQLSPHQQIQEMGADSIKIAILYTNIWRQFVFRKSNHSYPTVAFKQQIMKAKTIVELAHIIEQFNYESLTLLKEGLSPNLYIIQLQEQNSTTNELIRQVQQDSNIISRLFLLTPMPHMLIDTELELATQITDPIINNQAIGPYHLLFFYEPPRQIKDCIYKIFVDLHESVFISVLAEQANLIQIYQSIAKIHDLHINYSLRHHMQRQSQQIASTNSQLPLTNMMLTVNGSEILAYQFLKKFMLDDSNDTILFLMGEMGSGKTGLAYHLLQECFNTEAHQDYYLIYIDLAGIKMAECIYQYLEDLGVNRVNIEQWKQKKITFIADNYEQMDRYDSPSLSLEQWPNLSFLVISNIELPKKQIRETWKHSSITIAHMNYHPLQSTLLYPGIYSTVSNQAYKAAWQQIKCFFQMMMKRLKRQETQTSFEKFIADLKLFFAYFGEGFDLGFSGSYWNSPYTQEVIEHYQWAINSKYYALLKYALLINEKNIGHFAPWLKTACNLLEKGPSSSQSHSMLLSPNEINDKHPNIDHRFEIISKHTNLQPLFAFCALSGELPESYKEIAAALINTHTFIVINLPLPELIWTLPPYLSLRNRAIFIAEMLIQEYPNTDYYLIGWSFGGLSAFSVALALEALEKPVKLVYSVDTTPLEALSQMPLYKRSAQIIKHLIGNWHPGSDAAKSLFTLIDEWLLSTDDPQTLFRNTCVYLEQNHSSTDRSIQPLIERLNTSYLNLVAQYELAFAESSKQRAKLKAPHYSAIADIKSVAISNGIDNMLLWEKDCEIFNYKVFPGDHFSIFSTALLHHLTKTLVTTEEIVKLIHPLHLRIQNYFNKLITRMEVFQCKHLLPIPAKKQSQEQTEGVTSTFDFSLSFIASPHNILAITGVAGSGKSTLLQTISLQLANQYLNALQNKEPQLEGLFFPLLINSLDNPTQAIIKKLIQEGFTSGEANDLVQNHNLLLLLDEAESINYDPDKLFTQLKLKREPKIILVSRSDSGKNHSSLVNKEFLDAYKRIFYPSYNQSFFLPQSTMIELTLQALEPALIDECLAKSYQVIYNNYADLIKDYPTLKEVILNPLSLSLFLESFATRQNITTGLIKSKNSLTKCDLYAAYFEAYFTLHLEKFGKTKGIPPSVDFKKLYQQFAFELAEATNNSNAQDLDFHKFLNNDPVTTTLRTVCPIIIQGPKIKFLHDTFQDFLIAQKIFSELILRRNQLYIKYSNMDNVSVLDFLFDLLCQYLKANPRTGDARVLISYLIAIVTQRRRGANEVLLLFSITGCATEVSTEYGLLLYEAEQVEEAKAIFLKIIDSHLSENSPNLYTVYCNLGTASHENKEYSHANLFFEKALKLTNVRQRSNIGYLYNALANLYFDNNEENCHFNIVAAKEMCLLSISEKNRYPDIVKTKRFIGWGYYTLAKITVLQDQNHEQAKRYRDAFCKCIVTQFGEQYLWTDNYLNCLQFLDDAISDCPNNERNNLK